MFRSTVADKGVNVLRNIFAIHGYPLSTTSNNGCQFVSAVFMSYLKENRIEHRRITPMYRQAHREVKMKNLYLLKRLKLSLKLNYRNAKIFHYISLNTSFGYKY